MKKRLNLANFTVTLRGASAILGPGFSYATLRRRIDSGIFVEGLHWCSVGVGKNRQIRLNLDAVRDRSTWRG